MATSGKPSSGIGLQISDPIHRQPKASPTSVYRFARVSEREQANVRQSPVVLDLVFKARKFIDDLFALLLLFGVVAVAH